MVFNLPVFLEGGLVPGNAHKTAILMPGETIKKLISKTIKKTEFNVKRF